MGIFDIGAPAWSAIASWATFVVLAITLYFVHRQVAEATKLRREQARPYVAISIDVEQRALFMFTVENIGKTPAYDVRIDFDKPLQSSVKDIEELQILREPIPMLPPNRRLRAFWESTFEVFKEEYSLPLNYNAIVTYRDQHGKMYGPEVSVLDFRIYKGIMIGGKGIHELADAVENLYKVHRGWTNAGSGVLVHCVDEVKNRRRRDRPHHLGRMRSAYRDQGWKGAAGYWIKLLRRRYGLWFR